MHRRSRDTYGSHSIHAELADAYGIRVDCKRVASLIRQKGIVGASQRNYVVTTQSDSDTVNPVDPEERRF